MKTKLDEYNSYYNKVAKNQISSREVNGRFLLEGILKVLNLEILDPCSPLNYSRFTGALKPALD